MNRNSILAITFAFMMVASIVLVPILYSQPAQAETRETDESGDIVYGFYSGVIHGTDVESGERIYELNNNFSGAGHKPIVTDEHIYYLSDSGLMRTGLELSTETSIGPAGGLGDITLTNDGNIVHADSNGVVRKYDEDYNEVWNESYNTSTGGIAYDTSENIVYISDAEGDFVVIDADTGSEVNRLNVNDDVGDGTIKIDRETNTAFYATNAGDRIIGVDISNLDNLSVSYEFTPGGYVSAPPAVQDGYAYGATSDGMYIYNLDTETLEDSGILDAYSDTQVDIIDGDLYAPDGNNEIRIYDISEPGNPVHIDEIPNTYVRAFDFADESEPVSGQVVNQDGTAVSDAYVEIWGVDYSNITAGDGQTLEDRAEELLNEASDPSPPGFERGLDLIEYTDDTDATYVAANTREDWATASWVPTKDQTDVSDPLMVQPNPDEPIVLSVWDAGDGGLVQDGVDGDLMGSTVKSSEEIEITQIGPGGSELSSTVVETQEYWETGVLFGSTHWATEVRLDTGFYHIEHASASGETLSYTIAVGNPEDMIRTFEADLEDRAGNLSDRASDIAQRQQDEEIGKVTVQADSNGEFEAEVPNSWETVAVTAYSGGNEIEYEDPSEASLNDIREEFASYIEDTDDLEDLEQQDPFGSVYVAPEPVETSPPDEDVTVEVIELDSPNLSDIDSFMDNFGWLEEYLDNETWNELVGLADKDLDDIANEGEDSVNELKEELEQLKESNSELEAEYDRLAEDYANDVNRDVDELNEDEVIKLIEEAMAGQSPEYEFEFDDIQVEVDYPDGWDDDQDLDEPGMVDMVIPFDSGITGVDAEEAVVTARLSDGTTTTLDSEQYEVRSGVVTGADAVVISDYELPSDVHAVTFDVRVAGDSGVGSGSETVENPRSGFGNIPSIDSVNLNTIEGVAGNQMSVSVNSEDTDFRGVNAVRAYAPDGTEQTAQMDGTDAKFTPGMDGTYVLEIDVETRNDAVVTEVIRVPVNNQSVNYPTSVRVAEGMSGKFVIAGDNVSDAEFESTGSTARISMNVEDTNTGRIHAYISEGIASSDTDLEVRVMDEDGRQLDGHRTVHIYTAELGEDSLVYRNGMPMSENTRFGELEDRNGSSVIRTYTDANGSVDVEVNSSPSFYESLQYQFAEWRSSTSIPFLGLGFVPPLVGGLVGRKAGDYL